MLADQHVQLETVPHTSPLTLFPFQNITADARTATQIGQDWCMLLFVSRC